MNNNNPLFKIFFGTMITTAVIPYLDYLLPFIPEKIFGFNLSGWAWIIMLLVTIVTMFRIDRPLFPIRFWIPWVLYLLGYLALDFSFLGLQLSLQYILPLLVGVAASGFVYDRSALQYLYRLFGKFLIFVVGITIYGYLFRPWLPNEAMVPMTLSIGAALYLSVYHQLNDKRYLFYFFGLLLIPLVAVTRMGILVFLVIFVFHFAENRLSRKILYGTLGLVMGLAVFFSSKFQEKTFYGKQGGLADISINIYEEGGRNFDSSGRNSYYIALKPGLVESPVFGNGPRSDNEKLKLINKSYTSGEAHNDYLSVRYNYGWVGLVLLLTGFVLQFVNLFRRYLKEMMWNKDILMSAALVLHPALWLFMYSDNILKYTIYFTNFFFAMVGIAYAQYGRVNKFSNQQY